MPVSLGLDSGIIKFSRSFRLGHKQVINTCHVFDALPPTMAPGPPHGALPSWDASWTCQNERHLQQFKRCRKCCTEASDRRHQNNALKGELSENHTVGEVSVENGG